MKMFASLLVPIHPNKVNLQNNLNIQSMIRSADSANIHLDNWVLASVAKIKKGSHIKHGRNVVFLLYVNNTKEFILIKVELFHKKWVLETVVKL